MTELINNEAVCRTAPATPCLELLKAADGMSAQKFDFKQTNGEICHILTKLRHFHFEIQSAQKNLLLEGLTGSVKNI